MFYIILKILPKCALKKKKNQKKKNILMTMNSFVKSFCLFVWTWNFKYCQVNKSNSGLSCFNRLLTTNKMSLYFDSFKTSSSKYDKTT